MMEDDVYSAYSFLLEKTSRRVKQYAKKAFRENNFGITVDQWVVLKHLYYHNGISQSALAESTFKGMPTLTHILDLLQGKGLLTKEADTDDRRRTKIFLTEEGHEKVKTLLPDIQKLRQKAWENLSKEDFEHFTMTLRTIYQNLEG